MKSVLNRLSILATASALVLAQVIMPVHAAFALDTPVPGNNGTVKINDQDADVDPGVGNEPHLTTCDVVIRWYGYDTGSRASTVTFTTQDPTETQLVSPIGPQDSSFTATTSTTGNTLSNEKTYTLSFSGSPATQGYHVKATVYTDGSKGNNTKSKVFWLPSTCGPSVAATPDFTLTGVCGVNNDTVAVSESADYTAGAPIWNNSQVSVTFIMKAGINKLFSNGSTTITVTKDEVNINTECESAPKQIANPTITLTGVCGVNNDTVAVSESADYTAGAPIWSGSAVSVTFTIKTDVNKVFDSTGTKTVTVTADESNTSDCPHQPQPCAVHDNLFTKEWKYGEATMPEAGADPENSSALPGAYQFINNDLFTGIHLTTPATESYVDGLINAGKTPLADIDAMSYTTYRSPSSTGYAGTLPAYILLVDLDGNTADKSDQKYFFYEPYNNGTVAAGIWQTWDAIKGGTAQWWMSGTGQALQNWSTFVTANPNAVAIAYGFNQGTYNAGADTYIKSMTFDCATTTLSAPGKGETPQPQPETPATLSTPSTPVVPAGKGAVMPTELPETGSNFSPLLIGLLASAAAYGALYFAQPKRYYE